jgi:O-antigen/teichoic acid export membrane protein
MPEGPRGVALVGILPRAPEIFGIAIVTQQGFESGNAAAGDAPVPPIPPLGRAAGVALRWNGAAALMTLLSQLAQIFFLARWLTPADFGLAATVLGVMAFLGALSDLGLTNALVQRETLSMRSWAGAWWASAAAGTVLALLLVAAAPGLESVLHLPGMTPLLWAAALSLPWFGSASVYQAHLQRHLRLKRLASVEIAAAAVGLAVALAWAWWRPEPMALVAGQIALSVARFGGLAAVSSMRVTDFPQRPHWDELRHLAGFGGFQMAERVAAHAFNNLDRLLVASLLGPSAAGYYFMASQIALKPAALLGPFTARTLLPLLSRIRSDRSRTAHSYLRTLSLLAFCAGIVYTLLFGLAEPLVALVLGPRWGAAVVPLHLLAVAGFLMVLGNALGNLSLALGRAGVGFWLVVLVLVVRLGAILVGAPFGLRGVAAALLLVTMASMVIDVLLPKLWLGIRMRETLRAGGWTALPGAVAGASMIGICAWFQLSAFAELLVAGLAGSVLFALVAVWFHGDRTRTSIRELVDKLAFKRD